MHMELAPRHGTSVVVGHQKEFAPDPITLTARCFFFSGPSKDGVPATIWTRCRGIAWVGKQQRSRVGGNTPIGQSARGLPRGMSIPWAHTHFVDRIASIDFTPSSHLPRQSCGATRTIDASRPPSAIIIIIIIISLAYGEWANQAGPFRPAAGKQPTTTA